MCGIAGLMTAAPLPVETIRRHVERMSACIAYRGPDDDGFWCDGDAGVALGFRRLAIIDVSPAGHQPMSSASGRYTVVFNGEVYNYVEIRAELEREARVAFRGGSDTEVMLAAFERWGIDRAVRKFVGMFAIAVWDAHLRQLKLIRDRLGIKPLHYFHRDGLLSFGSELKALASGPAFDRVLDPAAIDAYLRYLYVPAPLTIFQHVRKLLPGHILTIDAGVGVPRCEPYWSIDEAYRAARADPIRASDAEVVDELRRHLADAVRLRMRSDVPMGALLSGGMDSSTVVAMMQATASRPVRTFSIGFPGTAHDEAAAADAIARVLGTDHTELSVTGDRALEVVPRLPELFDEPLADPSQIPTYLVCELARQAVTVALTGDGGDEIFAGYERYIQGERIISGMARVPRVLRSMAGAGIGLASARAWERAYRGVGPLVDPSGRHRLAGEKIRKLGRLLQQPGAMDMYRSLVSAGVQRPEDVLAATAESSGSRVELLLREHAHLPLLDAMMLTDQQTYLPDDLLAKVDRASMAVSLEARVPLLDHRVVEFSWRLDRAHKIRDGRGKWALRQVLYGLVDARLVDRPKTGFSVPLGPWLRGPLRPWAESLLFDRSGAADEWFVPAELRRRWTGLQRGGDQEALGLWAVLMFQAWRQRWAA